MKSSNVRFGTLWCRLMHTAPMWPMLGNYECRKCGRRHLVCWEGVLQVLPPAMMALVPEPPLGALAMATESSVPCS